MKIGDRNWGDEAERLFFICDKTIVEIAEELSLSRKAVGGYLKTCAAFSAEKERRKRKNAAGRREYKREWDRTNRRNPFQLGNGERESLKREHETAAIILSRERFYDE